MHTGKSYRLADFLYWTRRDLYLLAAVGVVAVLLYRFAGFRWVAIPWSAIAILGSATAIIVSFKNLQTYNRTWEARQIWGEIVGCSRAWAATCRDFVVRDESARRLVLGHLAWLTALRYQLREARAWETAARGANAEYRQRYGVPELAVPLHAELAKYLGPDELPEIVRSSNKATQILGLQSQVTLRLFAAEAIVLLQFVDLQKSLKELHLLQQRCERIKDFPFPRQYATVSSLCVKLFCLLLPFGLLREFDRLNEGFEGWMSGNMSLLAAPVSMLVSWMFVSLDRVGESTENPFEGGANDVPISQLCRSVEIDMRQLLGEEDAPPSLEAKGGIVM